MGKSKEAVIAVEKYKSKQLSKRVKQLEAIVEQQHDGILALSAKIDQIVSAINEEDEEEEVSKVGFSQAPTQEEE
tara:strand:+ start:128 stop:352 length:225 start_codon:yes stop_codon:yes gene_type:complete